MLTARAKKVGVSDLDLLPTVIDDEMCIALGHWRETQRDPDLSEAIEFLHSCIIAHTSRENAGERLYARKWVDGESLERYVTELQALAEACYIKPGDKAFKVRFIDGLPEAIRPLLRLELKSDGWPTISQLMEKVKRSGVSPQPPLNVFRPTFFEDRNEAVMAIKDIATQRRQCYNCGRYGHISRDCRQQRSSQHQAVGNRNYAAGKEHSSLERPYRR
jgi:hypothetical protein